MRNVDLVIDLQFGSTGKGLVAGFVATRGKHDTVMSAWAPNAGHTYIDASGRTYIHRMLPNGCVGPNVKRIMIGPGSIIDPLVLRRELDECKDKISPFCNILIHPSAAVVSPEHVEAEARNMVKIGSTGKGVGAAAIDRILRQPDKPSVARAHDSDTHQALVDAGLSGFVVSREEYMNALYEADDVLIEGAQGYSLSMYHGFYPYTTSRDVSTNQVLADVGMPPLSRWNLNVIGTARCHPIRVANRYDASGNMVGWSGPNYSDQRELDWEYDLGRPAELTTVTKLPRRIFTWSELQMKEAVRTCGVKYLFLNFLNYLPTRSAAERFVQYVQKEIADQARSCEVRFLGFGPSHNDVIDMHDYGDGRANNPFEEAVVRKAFGIPSVKD